MSSTKQHLNSNDLSVSRTVPSFPDGWQAYKSPDGGFIVTAPGNPTEVSSDELRMWKVTRYTFQDEETPLVIEIYSERTGAIATNTVDDLRDSPDMLLGSLHDVALPGMSGIEFRTKGRVGEVVHREYCSHDNTRSISIFVQKEIGGGISDAKVQLFLDSFKLLN
ncbi:MAG: hypothetical protein Q8M16_09045 [Pirellulaceae bacterium]|nr:hypothetical protein [Pirellulaceae bacterium]